MAKREQKRSLFGVWFDILSKREREVARNVLKLAENVVQVHDIIKYCLYAGEFYLRHDSQWLFKGFNE